MATPRALASNWLALAGQHPAINGSSSSARNIDMPVLTCRLA
jgi:hypothetical protein